MQGFLQLHLAMLIHSSHHLLGCQMTQSFFSMGFTSRSTICSFLSRSKFPRNCLSCWWMLSSRIHFVCLTATSFFVSYKHLISCGKPLCDMSLIECKLLECNGFWCQGCSEALYWMLFITGFLENYRPVEWCYKAEKLECSSEQATVGPCNLPKPWSWNVIDLAKWTR